MKEKIRDWLNSEGYPLEFKTAKSLRDAGFKTRQGYHVHDPSNNSVREIDVSADISRTKNDGFLRITHTIECKWSKDKPWVVFTSQDARMAPSACINQTMGDSYGRAILWTLAGKNELYDLSMFEAPERPGFTAKQCFSKNDQAYNAMQSITTTTSKLLEKYDKPSYNRENGFPDTACIALPCIVVDGEIFETFLSEESGEMELHPVNSARIHWRGAESRRHITTIDIVRSSHLPEFAARRAKEAEIAMGIFSRAMDNIEHCIQDQSLDKLEVFPGARGTQGLPPLLYKIYTVQKLTSQPPPTKKP
ncbi:hypothetical protein [Corallococcus sp. AS-1-12]|uniref:hypothetical protein n=1 Tax=Corallococcus sp. AS-1-12 TaxID=2874598 RepID=UPI001CBC31A8|nr:hypothetical protein [Corallococcus sp. AS-1-12]MBZ4335074.1 hypothetical protein [Corallococcus sp. AS-1-12]